MGELRLVLTCQKDAVQVQLVVSNSDSSSTEPAAVKLQITCCDEGLQLQLLVVNDTCVLAAAAAAAPRSDLARGVDQQLQQHPMHLENEEATQAMPTPPAADIDSSCSSDSSSSSNFGLQDEVHLLQGTGFFPVRLPDDGSTPGSSDVIGTGRSSSSSSSAGSSAEGSSSGSSGAGGMPCKPLYFSNDLFMMTIYKVVTCSIKRPHDITACPYAHPGCELVRRCPSTHSATLCRSVRDAKVCALGDQCSYSHNFLERFLHPDKYRTVMCFDGACCSKALCFSAHSQQELRAAAHNRQELRAPTPAPEEQQQQQQPQQGHSSPIAQPPLQQPLPPLLLPPQPQPPWSLQPPPPWLLRPPPSPRQQQQQQHMYYVPVIPLAFEYNQHYQQQQQQWGFFEPETPNTVEECNWQCQQWQQQKRSSSSSSSSLYMTGTRNVLYFPNQVNYHHHQQQQQQHGAWVCCSRPGSGAVSVGCSSSAASSFTENARDSNGYQSGPDQAVGGSAAAVLATNCSSSSGSSSSTATFSFIGSEMNSSRYTSGVLDEALEVSPADISCNSSSLSGSIDGGRSRSGSNAGDTGNGSESAMQTAMSVTTPSPTAAAPPGAVTMQQLYQPLEQQSEPLEGVASNDAAAAAAAAATPASLCGGGAAGSSGGDVGLQQCKQPEVAYDASPSNSVPLSLTPGCSLDITGSNHAGVGCFNVAAAAAAAPAMAAAEAAAEVAGAGCYTLLDDDEGHQTAAVAAAAASALHDGAINQQEQPADGEPCELDRPEYKTDEFRMYQFKIKQCTNKEAHGWRRCPFAHPPGEPAQPRDPRLFNYTGIHCPDYYKKGTCKRGIACPYAHGVFEMWLHPSRYRTQICKDAPHCTRQVCFHAHSLEEVRHVEPQDLPVLGEVDAAAAAPPPGGLPPMQASLLPAQLLVQEQQQPVQGTECAQPHTQQVQQQPVVYFLLPQEVAQIQRGMQGPAPAAAPAAQHSISCLSEPPGLHHNPSQLQLQQHYQGQTVVADQQGMQAPAPALAAAAAAAAAAQPGSSCLPEPPGLHYNPSQLQLQQPVQVAPLPVRTGVPQHTYCPDPAQKQQLLQLQQQEGIMALTGTSTCGSLAVQLGSSCMQLQQQPQIAHQPVRFQGNQWQQQQMAAAPGPGPCCISAPAGQQGLWQPVDYPYQRTLQQQVVPRAVATQLY